MQQTEPVQNLVISSSVIVLLIIMSVLSIVQLGVAVFLYEDSTLVVVANALRLVTYKPTHSTTHSW